MLFTKYPRARYEGASNTPLERAERLSATLGGPELFIKRDDVTALSLGGNKVRKLEFLMGDAKARGCDAVITTGGPQSNHARMTAAFARKLGMKPVLLLKGGPDAARQGNLLLDTILGADLHFVGAIDLFQGGAIESWKEKILHDLKSQGYTPYYIPLGGSNPLGTLGYVRGMMELVGQINDMELNPRSIVLASGSGGTHAGLLAGKRMLNLDMEVIGISVARQGKYLETPLMELVNSGTLLLGKGSAEIGDLHQDIRLFDDYLGEGYGKATEACIKAIKLLARTEGIILDQVYTGKAMAGLIDLIEKGYFGTGDQVVFLHSGGSPAVFAQPEAFVSE